MVYSEGLSPGDAFRLDRRADAGRRDALLQTDPSLGEIKRPAFISNGLKLIRVVSPGLNYPHFPPFWLP